MTSLNDLSGDSLVVSIDAEIATLTLNRPSQHNALSRELRTNIAIALQALKDDDRVGVVVFTGAGDRAFSVGADLHELEKAPLAPDEVGVGSAVMQAFANLGKPTIAAVNGLAVTGGFELAVNCGIILATSDAKFADTHSRVGVMSSWGLSQYLVRMVGPVRARYLSLTGRYLDAPTAKAWGLVLDTFEQADLMPAAYGIAQDILAGDRTTILDLERSIRLGVDRTLEEGLLLEEELARASVERFDPEQFATTRAGIFARGKALAG